MKKKKYCEKCSYISIQCLCIELALEPNIFYLQEKKKPLFKNQTAKHMEYVCPPQCMHG